LSIDADVLAPTLSICFFHLGPGGDLGRDDIRLPSRRAVAIACRPATPAPMDETLAETTMRRGGQHREIPIELNGQRAGTPCRSPRLAIDERSNSTAQASSSESVGRMPGPSAAEGADGVEVAGGIKRADVDGRPPSSPPFSAAVGAVFSGKINGGQERHGSATTFSFLSPFSFTGFGGDAEIRNTAV